MRGYLGKICGILVDISPFFRKIIIYPAYHMIIREAVRLEEKKVCPKCGEEAMVKRVTEDGKYTWLCTNCGTSRGKFEEDKKKGTV